MGKAYLGSTLVWNTEGGATADDNGWVRPADWLAMPTTATNQIDILCAVYDTSSNSVGLTVSVSAGTYDVDWGDGVIDTGITSNTAAQHNYDYADTDLDGTLSSLGYKQAMIKITPNTGGANITVFTPATKGAISGPGQGSNSYLDIQVNAPSCAGALTFSSDNNSTMCWLPVCERVNIIAIGAVTSFLMAGMASLQSVTFPSGSLASVTTLASAFNNCPSLKKVTFPSGSLASVTTITQAFLSCASLEEITFPSGSLGSCNIISSFVSGCRNLKKITFPSGAFGAGLTGSTTSAFVGATLLQSITNCNIAVSFTLNGRFNAAALDAIYTALPTVTSQTLTVTSIPGTSGDDPTIATAKGWTVTG